MNAQKFNYFKDDSITVDSGLEPFIGELCHRYDMKVLNKINIRQQWGGQYWTMTETVSGGSEKYYDAYVLSRSGFPEIVAWTDGETYYMSADAQLKERSDSKFLSSKRLPDLMKKFDKRVNTGRHNPLDLKHWSTGGHYADIVVQDVSSSSKLTKAYSDVSMNGAELHLLLNSFINHVDVSSSQRQSFETKLQDLDIKYNEVQNASNIIREKLEKPFYVVSKSLLSFRDESCVVWKAKIINNQFVLVETPKAYKRFEDCPVHDRLRPITTMFAITHEDKSLADASANYREYNRSTAWLLDKVIPQTGLYSNIHMFDDDTCVGYFDYIRCHNDFKMVYTYILDVD
jgi:hypothetical protein